MWRSTTLAAWAAVGVLLGGCGGSSRGSAGASSGATATATSAIPSSGASASAQASGFRRVATLGGFEEPEALVYDSADDAFLVSNIVGQPGAKDGNGYVSRLSADGRMRDQYFIGRGRNGVTLDSPMGSRIHGDTLWLVDVDKLRVFDARTGRAYFTVDLAPLHARMLNDLTFAPDGSIYLTDMGMTNGKHTGPDRVYRIGPDRKPTIALDTLGLDQPDGIAWASDGRLLTTPFGGSAVLAWRPGEHAPTDVAPGAGKFDGIEVERDGRVFLTAWNDSTLHALDGTTLTKVITGLPSPSDVSMDTRRNRLAVSLMMPGEVQIWQKP